MFRIPVVQIESTESGEMDYDDFRARLKENEGSPAIVAINIGTTVKGAVDSLAQVKSALYALLLCIPGLPSLCLLRAFSVPSRVANVEVGVAVARAEPKYHAAPKVQHHTAKVSRIFPMLLMITLPPSTINRADLKFTKENSFIHCDGALAGLMLPFLGNDLKARLSLTFSSNSAPHVFGLRAMVLSHLSLHCCPLCTSALFDRLKVGRWTGTCKPLHLAWLQPYLLFAACNCPTIGPKRPIGVPSYLRERDRLDFSVWAQDAWVPDAVRSGYHQEGAHAPLRQDCRVRDSTPLLLRFGSCFFLFFFLFFLGGHHFFGYESW